MEFELNELDRFMLARLRDHPIDIVYHTAQSFSMSERNVKMRFNRLLDAGIVQKGYIVSQTFAANEITRTTTNLIPPTAITKDDVMFTPNPPKLGVVINVSELMDLDGNDK